MRSETEIVAMRDQLQRREWSHGVGELNDVTLSALQWACDPSRSDREVLDLSDTDLIEGMTTLDALDALSGDNLAWSSIDNYLQGMATATRKNLTSAALKLYKHCLAVSREASGNA